MAHTPINVFSQHCDPAGVLAALKELLPGCTVVPDAGGNGWSSVSGTWKRGWLKSALTLKATHDASYYAGDGWPGQLSGMAGFFRRFPDATKRPDLFGYIPGLKFAVSFILDPAPVDADPRQAVISRIAELVDGVIFLPRCLLDAQGRAIVSADGGSDPEAQLPKHEPESHAVEAAIDAPEETGDPPSEERVIERLVFMGALVNRGFLESESEGESIRQKQVAELKQSAAWTAGEPDECAALETPVGQLPGKTVWQLPWLSEGAMVLAWALELVDLPAYDQQVDVHRLYEVIDKIKSGGLKPVLRPRSDLEQLAFQMLAIHWRLTEYSVNPKAMNFEEYAPRAWCGAMDLSLAKLLDHDLAIKGVPLSQSAEDDWKMAGGIMEERRRAIHWLLGYDPVYSKNDTST